MLSKMCRRYFIEILPNTGPCFHACPSLWCIPGNLHSLFHSQVKRVTRHVEWAGFRQFFASKDYCKLTFLMLGCMDKSQWIMFEALGAAWTQVRRFKATWPAIYWKKHCVECSVSTNFQWWKSKSSETCQHQRVLTCILDDFWYLVCERNQCFHEPWPELHHHHVRFVIESSISAIIIFIYSFMY